ncbi:MAG: nicotinamide-nucleotide amidohydrolase family protein [Candidatus Thermoplasmatota archaeon]|nr:nicotinamide-nucleotide amidohydrolase family protein [Candidatus Thermoplasmatota archaeon]
MTQFSWEQLVRLSVDRGLWISTAESCTGGYISSRITDVPGASECFKGAIISYSNEVKADVLGVSPETLREYGSVSRETALEMSLGALKELDCDLSAGVTGIAGPSGGSDEKPVGTVHISVCKKSGYERSESFIFNGLSRVEFKKEVSKKALDMLMLAALEGR